MNKEGFVRGTIITLNLAALAFSGFGSNSNKKVESKSTLPGEACSFDPDCKNQDRPYCNVVYDLDSGNYGVCGEVNEPDPLQVVDGEACPTGTKRQEIYNNEGSEAVCLD